MAVPGAVVMVGCAVAGASSSPVMWLYDGDGGVAVANAGSMALMLLFQVVCRGTMKLCVSVNGANQC